MAADLASPSQPAQGGAEGPENDVFVGQLITNFTDVLSAIVADPPSSGSEESPVSHSLRSARSRDISSRPRPTAGIEKKMRPYASSV